MMNLNDKSLIIPISMRALAVGNESKMFADKTFQYSSLEDSPIGDGIEPNLDSFHAEDKGIHIHWNLPEFFLKGFSDDSYSDIKYPYLPNRWCVTRIWLDSEGGVHSKNWMIESDVLQKEPSVANGNLRSPQVPFFTDPDQPYRYLGRTYLLGNDVENGLDSLESLNATIGGAPVFSGYYQDCRNVFGMYDDMLDISSVQQISVSYVVCGWFSDCKKDMISLIKGRHDFLSKLSLVLPDGLKAPDNSVCHGILCGVKWEGLTQRTDFSIDGLRIAIGNNTAEALSVLAQSENLVNGSIERILNIHHVRHENFTQNSTAVIDAENKVHESRFSQNGIPTQVYWKSKDPAISIEPKVLEKINGLFEEFFKEQEVYHSLQERLFDAWNKYIYLGSQPYFSAAEKKRAAFAQSLHIEQMNALIISLHQKMKLIASIDQDISDIKNSVPHSIDCLINENGQPFWQPNNPVLLFDGLKSDQITATGVLYCRSAEQLISSLTIDQLEGYFTTPCQLCAQDITFAGNSPNQLIGILLEAVFLSVDFCSYLASMILEKKGCKTAESLAALVSVIQKLQSLPNHAKMAEKISRHSLAKSAGFSGVFPDRQGFLVWTPSWNPIMIRWFVKYLADPNVCQNTPVLDHWEMKAGAIDFTFSGSMDTSKSYRIQGQAYLAETPKAVAQETLNLVSHSKSLVAMDALSQSLDINGALLMEKPDLRLPISAIDSSKLSLDGTVVPVAQIISLLGSTLPEIANFDNFFFPLRAGFLSVEKVSVIDSFGLVFDCKNPKLIVSENMRQGESLFQDYAMLTPRLVQPSRLNFKWLDPDTNAQKGEDFTDSPICGWLLPNHMDLSLMVYSHEGELCGSLQHVSLGTTSVVWKNPPEKGGGTAEIPQEMNETLKQIVQAILTQTTKDNDCLSQFLDVIDSALWNINPSSAEQFNDLGQYIGRPLIVVNGQLALEQKGLLKNYKHLETRDMPKQIPNVNDVELNIHVGYSANHDDGMIGYFVENNFESFYVIGGDGATTNPFFVNHPNIIKLFPNNPKPKTLTIIMDFLGRIDFMSGFLPAKTIRINPDVMKDALNKLYFTVSCNPVLVDGVDFSVPCPKLEGKKWDWISIDKVGLIESEFSYSSPQGYFPEQPFQAHEGWLKLRINQMENSKNNATRGE